MEINLIYKQIFKPVFDFCLAFCTFLLCSPVILLIAVLLILQNRPVFFRHMRPGLNGKPFRVYKFTSLIDGNPNTPFRFGRFLRSTSLDELPQLINVIKGEMSIIGPRPLLMEYLSDYSEEQGRRHCVKPGITGWAQVHGRNILSLEEKIKLDLYYVDHLSPTLDMKVLFFTLKQLVRWQESDYHRLNEAKEVV